MLKDISEVIVSAVDRGIIESNQNYTIYISCFSTKYAALRRKSQYWLSQNQDNVSKWRDMSISGLLFQ
jgi:hypothetical protein